MLAFARKVIECALEGHEVDGSDVQDWATEAGLLVPTTMAEACGEHCPCAEVGDFPQTCYRYSPALTGGRPAAEPPDVREAATILLAELWNRGWRGLTEADATAIAGKMFSRAALGAAPPTQEGA